MIKFNAGWIEHRAAHLIGLGLSDDNLSFLKEGRPIRVKSEELGLPAPGCVIVLFHTRDQDDFRHALSMFIASEHLTPGDDVTIVAMHVDKVYYVAPLLVTNEPGMMVYFVGLDDVAYARLRGGSLPTFRFRFMEGEGTSVEILLFWGATEEAMEAEFYASGLITPDTKVLKL